MTDHANNRANDNHANRSSYDEARASASRTYHDARDKAGDAARRAASEIEANPLAILAGGLAIGALVGTLIPRSTREKELLAPVGQRLGATARQAFVAARDAGRQELDQAGLTKGAARDRGKDLLDGVVKALSSAGTAAVQAAKKPGVGAA